MRKNRKHKERTQEANTQKKLTCATIAELWRAWICVARQTSDAVAA